MNPFLPFTLLVSLSTAASASWVDKFGRVTELSFPGIAPATLAAAQHSAADGVEAFSEFCLKTNFDRSSVEKAIAASDWRFSYQSEMVPFKNPVDVGGWNAPDAALRMAKEIFFNKKAQCNLTFAPSGPVSTDTILDAISNVAGKSPDNIAKRFDKNGSPAKYFSPEWTISRPDGSVVTIYFHQSQNTTSTIHLAVIKN